MLDEFIIARFYRGPYDSKTMVLPCNPPWPRFVIPQFEVATTIEWFYLLAGELEDNIFSYLFDDSFGGITDDVSITC